MGVEEYDVIQLVGEGSFGKVYRGRRKYSGLTVAMKFITKHGKSKKDIQNLRQEIEILRSLKHENIIEMIDSFESPEEFCVIAEFAQGALFVGQPPFYTNTVYALIRNIVKDPVKYPDHCISPNFKTFLKGLLNKVPQNRLTWPALLEHPFVKENSHEIDPREMCAATAASGGYDAAARDVENSMQPSPVLIASTTEGNQLLDRLESDSLTVKGAQFIGQDSKALRVILLPLKKWSKESHESWSSCDQDVLASNQSLRVISNLAATGAIHSSGLLDEILCEVLNFTAILISLKSYALNELVVKSFSIINLLLGNIGNGISSSYLKHWVVVTEIFSLIVDGNEDTSGRVLYESCACITIMLSKVAEGLKATSLFSEAAPTSLMNETMKQILDHAKTCGLLEHLTLCLATTGSSLISGSAFMFPLNASRSHSLPCLDIQDQEQSSLVRTDSERIIDAVARAFLRSKPVKLAIYYCLQHHLEPSLSASIQLLSRCCLHNAMVSGVLCGLPSSLPVSTLITGGEDRTILAEIFSILSLCASSNKETDTSETSNLKFKSKLLNSSALVLHSCLFLAIVARCLKSAGRNSAVLVLTNSPEKQLFRLSVIAHQFSPDDRKQTSLQPHFASAMLDLASILSLESGASVDSSISKMAMPLIPQIATLCEQLHISPDDDNEVGPIERNGDLSYWHGLKDGCVGLLESRLKWEGPSALQQSCASGMPQLLIDLLANNHSITSDKGIDVRNDRVGLSALGVVWTVSSIYHCLSGGASIARQILFRNKLIEHISELISDLHLKLVKCCCGAGGGKDA